MPIKSSKNNVFVLIGGSDYSGSWKVYQSVKDAKRFLSLLVSKLNVPSTNITVVLSKKYNRKNVLKELKILSEQLEEKKCVGVIYFAGHGTQIHDRDGDESDGRDEALQLHDRRLISDDELSAPFLNIHPTSKLITIADTCHSVSLDMNRGGDVNWISIKAALDHQSAIQSGDGSCMSVQLFEILSDDEKITIKELKEKLEMKMRQSFIGNLQKCKVEVSNVELWNDYLF